MASDSVSSPSAIASRMSRWRAGRSVIPVLRTAVAYASSSQGLVEVVGTEELLRHIQTVRHPADEIKYDVDDGCLTLFATSDIVCTAGGRGIRGARRHAWGGTAVGQGYSQCAQAARTAATATSRPALRNASATAER